MEKIEKTKLEDIEVPEGLESRLLSKIDLWAEAERQERGRVALNHPRYRRQWLRRASVAAVLAVIIVAASMVFKPRNSALVDTYDDSRMAYRETVSVLNMLSETLSMGKDEVEALDLFCSLSDSITSSSISNNENILSE